MHMHTHTHTHTHQRTRYPAPRSHTLMLLCRNCAASSQILQTQLITHMKFNNHFENFAKWDLQALAQFLSGVRREYERQRERHTDRECGLGKASIHMEKLKAQYAEILPLKGWTFCEGLHVQCYFFFFFAKHIVVGCLIIQHTPNTITCSRSFILHSVYKK